MQFLREQSYHSHHQSVNFTRALFCELIASKILRRFNEDSSGPEGLLLLANVLVASFEPFQNAPEDIIRENSLPRDWAVHKRGGHGRSFTALEVAIISQSKWLLSSSACQRVVDAIYRGRVTYTPSSFMDILPDHYKHKPILLYDPRKAPLINQYRLMVPRTRNILEVCQFVILLILYLVVMENYDGLTLTVYETLFTIYAFGWCLDQFATILEHGWQVYTQNLWSFLDVIFTAIFGIYLILRVHGLTAGNDWSSQQALDILSTAAPVLVPRLAFNLMSENVLFVSLREMMANFTYLTALAAWCFGGFLLAMKWLSNGVHRPITISKWMLWVWFGLDGTGIQRSVDFHWLLGPILMVTFAFLGNTLFLTILVSMLTNTFSVIVSNVNAEIQFRRAVLTFEGVKSDAIFAYQPPFNIMAVFIMLPLKFIVSPRWFHKINVTAVRILNAPLLLIISVYERKYLWTRKKIRTYEPSKTRTKLASWGFSKLSVHGDIQAVFESDPPDSILGDLSEGENLHDHLEDESSVLSRKRREAIASSSHKGHKTRKDSIDSLTALPDHLPEMLHHYLGGNTKSRLEALEDTTSRMEDMLTKLCQQLLENTSSEAETPQSH